MYGVFYGTSKCMKVQAYESALNNIHECIYKPLEFGSLEHMDIGSITTVNIVPVRFYVGP